MWIWSLGLEDSLEKEMAIHSSILAWKIPWTEEPGEQQSMGLQRVRHNWVTNTHTHTHTHISRFLSSLSFNHTYTSGKLYTVSKARPGADCGSDHELLIAKFRLKLKKVGKTTRSFSYDLNQIPFYYLYFTLGQISCHIPDPWTLQFNQVSSS